MQGILERFKGSLRFREPQYLAELSVADFWRRLIFSTCAGVPKALPEDMCHSSGVRRRMVPSPVQHGRMGEQRLQQLAALK